jgi:hypothetical protein
MRAGGRLGELEADDGQWIVYLREESESDIMLVENFR